LLYSNSASSSYLTPNQAQEYPFLPLFPDTVDTVENITLAKLIKPE